MDKLDNLGDYFIHAKVQNGGTDGAEVGSEPLHRSRVPTGKRSAISRDDIIIIQKICSAHISTLLGAQGIGIPQSIDHNFT